MVLLAFAGFVSAANLRVCDPLLPQIARDLGVTIGSAGAIVMVYFRSWSAHWEMHTASCG
jgi:predicted MFS family arabinose efflux permease